MSQHIRMVCAAVEEEHMKDGIWDWGWESVVLCSLFHFTRLSSAPQFTHWTFPDIQDPACSEPSKYSIHCLAENNSISKKRRSVRRLDGTDVMCAYHQKTKCELDQKTLEKVYSCRVTYSILVEDAPEPLEFFSLFYHSARSLRFLRRVLTQFLNTLKENSLLRHRFLETFSYIFQLLSFSPHFLHKRAIRLCVVKFFLFSGGATTNVRVTLEKVL